jgi:hypothetical protein
LTSRQDVVIVSTHDDVHAVSVACEIKKLGRTATILNNAEFPQKWSIETNISDRGVRFKLHSRDGHTLESERITGVWWRRPQQYNLDYATPHPILHEFASAECSQAIQGSLTSAVSNFINNISCSRQANYKVLQLREASSCGLKVPPTLITNDQAVAAEFGRTVENGCIYKTFTGCDFGFYETRSLSSDEDYSELWRVQHCPVIFQKHVAGEYDVRATIVGDSVFSARLLYKKGRHPIDSRVDRVPIEIERLPPNVETQLISLTKRLGLTYSAIDLRFSPNDGYTFFELNPEGQFLWIEIETKLPISAALAARLTTLCA